MADRPAGRAGLLPRLGRAGADAQDGGAAVPVLPPGAAQRHRPPVGGVGGALPDKGRRHPVHQAQRPAGAVPHGQRRRSRSGVPAAVVFTGPHAGADPAAVCGGLLRCVHADAVGAGGGGAAAVYRAPPELPPALHPGHAAGPSPRAQRRVGRGALPPAAGQEPRLLSGAPCRKPDGAAPADPEAAERPAAAAGRRRYGGADGPSPACAGMARRRAGR